MNATDTEHYYISYQHLRP